MKLSEEERKRRSELAKRLREQGKLGGKQPGSGRPKQKRATEVVSEGAKEDGNKILALLRKLAFNSNSEATRLKALLTYLDIESKETDRQAKEQQKMYENVSRDKLLEMIGQRFKQLQNDGVDVEGLLFEKVQGTGREPTAVPIEGNGRALESGDKGQETSDGRGTLELDQD